MVGGLRTRAAWTFVYVGDFQSVEVGEELTVSSSQSKDHNLSCSVQLVDAVLLCLGAASRRTASPTHHQGAIAAPFK